MEYADLRGWKFMHLADSRRQVRPGVFVGDKHAAGWPDLFLVRERPVALELKATKGRTSPKQELWIEALRRAGIETYVVRPEEWGFIEELLR